MNQAKRQVRPAKVRNQERRERAIKRAIADLDTKPFFGIEGRRVLREDMIEEDRVAYVDQFRKKEDRAA